MSKRPRHQQAACDWPSTPDIDGHVWSLGPEPEDARWAEAHLNGDDWHTEEPVPDEILDRMAAEAEALARLERGYAE
jgi:hypothetical protein